MTFVRDVAAALIRYADSLEKSGPPAAQGPPDILDAPYLGPRQRQILKVLLEAGEEGKTSGEIANAIDYDQPNVWLTLKALVDRGLVVKWDDRRPHRYQLADRFRVVETRGGT